MFFPAFFVFLYIRTVTAFYANSPAVIELNADNFDIVKQSKEAWVVEYFAKWCVHCEKFAVEYVRAATALEGVVKFGAVDATQNKELITEHGIVGFPTVNIYTGTDQPEKYDGDGTAADLVHKVLLKVYNMVNQKLDSSINTLMFRDTGTVELTDSNFEENVFNSKKTWLVVFYSPYCHHCNQLASHWSRVSRTLSELCKVGSLDATMHSNAATKYQVDAYPSLQLFHPSEGVGIKYDLDLSTDSIVAWTKERISEVSPDPVIKQILDRKMLENTCKDTPLCIVSFLPDILSCQAKCRNEYLSILNGLCAKFKRNLWGWVWSAAGEQPEIERVLEVGGSGFPTMVVVNVRKMMYSGFVGQFSFEGINEFLRNLSFGKGEAVPLTLSEMPKIIRIKPWDGMDVQEPEVEDFSNDIKTEL